MKSIHTENPPHHCTFEERARARRLQLSAQQRERALLERPSTAVVDLSSNDYLALTRRKELLRCHTNAVASGAGGSRLVSGTFSEHLRLEEALAAHLGRDAALLFGAGYLANIGVLPTILGKDDVVFSDRQVHASMLDGIRLARARHLRFRHNSAEHLRSLLRREAAARKRGAMFVVAVESVYSMDGDVAPLAELAAVAAELDASLYIDEAHALGVFGERGEGLAGALGLALPDAVLVGTLSKAFGSYGGVVWSAKEVSRLLVSASRSFMFNTALPPSVAAASHAALELLDGPLRGEGHRLLARAERFASALLANGVPVGFAGSQIIPVIVGDSEPALRLSAALRGRGILTPAIRPPTVPPGTARLRLSVSLHSTEEDLERAAAAIGEEWRRL